MDEVTKYLLLYFGKSKDQLVKSLDKFCEDFIIEIIIKFGFKQTIHDPFAFHFINHEGKMYLVIYSDDKILSSSTIKLRDLFLNYLKSHVTKLKVNFENIKFLGMKLTRNIELRKYIYLKRIMQLNLLNNSSEKMLQSPNSH